MQGLCGYFISSIRTAHPEWLREHKVTMLVQEANQRHPDFPNVTTVFEYAKDKKTKQAFKLVFGWQVMGRPFTLPPGVPADRAKALRKAFAATMKDPKFLTDAKHVRLLVAPRTPKQIYLPDDAWKTPPDVVHSIFVALGRDKAGLKEKKHKKKM